MSNPEAILPFFLHPDDNPTLVLVEPVLNEHNYHTWSRSMKMSLISKNKLGFVDGTIKAPPTSDAMFSLWQKCNNMVISWLVNSISPYIAESVLDLNTAEEIWNVLYASFAQRDSLRLSDLMDEFHSLKQGSRSITEYYTLLKIVWDEMLDLRPVPSCPCQPKCTCVALSSVEECFNADQVIQFVKGLDDNFASLKTQILLMKPLPPITTAFSMAITAERQLLYTENHPHSGTIPTPANQSFSSSVNYDTGGNGVRMLQQPYNTLNIGKGKSWVQVPKKIKCTFCGLNGHSIEKCYKKHGYPPGWHRPRANPSHNIVNLRDLGTSQGDNLVSLYDLGKSQGDKLVSIYDLGTSQGDNLGSRPRANPSHTIVSNGDLGTSQSDNLGSSSSAPITQGQFQMLLQMLYANSITSNSSVVKGAAEMHKLMEHMVNPTTALQVDIDKSKPGDLKGAISQEIGLEAEMQKDDCDHLQMAGVKDNSNVLLGEDTREKAISSNEINETNEISRGSEIVAEIRAEVDKLAEKVSAVQVVVNGGTKIDEKDINYLTEMLMRELLKLDNIDAAGEGKRQRKMEARRIQSIIDEMDNLKGKKFQSIR